MRYKNLSLRRKLTFCLDILLFVLLVLSLSPRLTGLPLHEIIGPLLFFPILIHTLVEWRWFVNYIGRFLKVATLWDKFNLFLNTLLFIALIFEIVSGLVISQVLLPFGNVKTINDAHWRFWHNQISTLTMFLVGFHLALSWNRIVFYFKKGTNSPQGKKRGISINIVSTLYRICIFCMLAGMVAILSFLVLGNPSAARLYTGDEIARFRPTVFHGILQFSGETFLVVMTCVVARRWFKVRL